MFKGNLDVSVILTVTMIYFKWRSAVSELVFWPSWFHLTADGLQRTHKIIFRTLDVAWSIVKANNQQSIGERIKQHRNRTSFQNGQERTRRKIHQRDCQESYSNIKGATQISGKTIISHIPYMYGLLEHSGKQKPILRTITRAVHPKSCGKMCYGWMSPMKIFIFFTEF